MTDKQIMESVDKAMELDQGYEKALEDIYNKIDEGVCDICKYKGFECINCRFGRLNLLERKVAVMTDKQIMESVDKAMELDQGYEKALEDVVSLARELPADSYIRPSAWKI